MTAGGASRSSSADAADAAVRQSYDEIPYLTQARRRAHPDLLNVLATLFGLAPQPVERCRVLELGCGTGANIAAIAYALPGSECVGLDLSARQIAIGSELVREAGVANLKLEVGNLRDVGPALGRFDYIIAHGFLSWLPPDLQPRLFDIFKAHLAPGGIVYVGYNTLPGWHLRGVVRDMMLFHTQQISGAQARLDQARALINTMADSVVDADSAYAALLRAERDNVAKLSDSHLAHDLLAPYNTAFYFRDFAALASRHGLKFFAETAFDAMLLENFPAPAAELLDAVAGVIEREQFADFLINRSFRESLLCHDDAPLQRPITAARVSGLHVASMLHPDGVNLDVRAPGPATFRDAGGTVVAIEGAVSKAALVELARSWPAPIAFNELVGVARGQAGGGSEGDAGELAALLLSAFAKNLVAFHAYRPPIVTEVTPRPIASAWARAQAARGSVVVNLMHDNVELDDPVCHRLVPLLDGSADRAALTEVLSKDTAAGAFADAPPGSVAQAGAGAHDAGAMLDAALARLAHMALLVG